MPLYKACSPQGVFFLMSLLCLPLAPYAHAQGSGTGAEPIGVVGGVVGKVYVLRGGDKLRAAKGMEIFKEDQLVTGKNSVAKIVFADGSSATSSEEGSVEIEDFRTLTKGNKIHLDSAFNVISGKVRFFVKPREGGHSSKVRTANSVMGVRGTLFYVDAEPVSRRTRVVVEEGQVAVSNTVSPSKEIVLVPGEASVVTAEGPAEKAPAGEGAALVAGFKAAEKTVPEPLPEGVVPEGLDLPPPDATPGRTVRVNAPLADQKDPAHSAGKTRGSKSNGDAKERTVETGGVVVVPLEHASPPCTATNMATLRTLAQELDAGATEAASSLFLCEGYAHEAIFWITFLHQAHRAPGAVEDAVRAARPDQLPLDVKSPRRFALEEALKGKIEAVRRLNAQALKNAQAHKLGKKNFSLDSELLLVEARTAARLGTHADALRVYDEAVRTGTDGLGGTEQTEIERAYVLLLARRFETAANEFHRLSGSKDDRIVKQANRGLFLARRAGIPLSASRDNRFTLQAIWRRDFDDRRQTVASLRWESRLVSLGLSSGALGAPAGVTKSERLKTTSTAFHAWRDFKLSSGVTAGGEVGLFSAAGKNSVFFEARGAYESLLGVGVQAAFGSEPLARGAHGEPLVDAATVDFKTTRLVLGLGWKEWLRYSFTRSTVENFSPSIKNVLEGRFPLHRGETPLESVVALADASLVAWGEDVPVLFSPRSQSVFGGGVEGSYPLARWFAVEAGFGVHVAGRKKWNADDSAAKSTGSEKSTLAGTRSERRETVESDTALAFRGGLVFPFSPLWDAALGIWQESANDAQGQAVSRDTRIQATVHWNYGRSGTKQEPPSVASLQETERGLAK